MKILRLSPSLPIWLLGTPSTWRPPHSNSSAWVTPRQQHLDAVQRLWREGARRKPSEVSPVVVKMWASVTRRCKTNAIRCVPSGGEDVRRHRLWREGARGTPSEVSPVLVKMWGDTVCEAKVPEERRQRCLQCWWRCEDTPSVYVSSAATDCYPISQLMQFQVGLADTAATVLGPGNWLNRIVVLQMYNTNTY
jgi:hypothetical protein